MNRFTITVVEHEVETKYTGGYNHDTQTIRTDTQRYQQTVNSLDIEAVIEAVNRKLELKRDKPTEGVVKA